MIDVDLPVLLFLLLMSPYIHLIIICLVLFVGEFIDKIRQIISNLLHNMFDNWFIVLLLAFFWIKWLNL